jgi:ADP-ribosyl-[dinitrogen reductase] hydrolase
MLRGKTDLDQIINVVLPMVENRDVREAIVKATDSNCIPGISGFVLDTLGVAFHALYYTDSFEEAVVHAVNVGGDTDTHGAVTGALAGAYYGFEAIPKRWLDVIQNCERLVKLAEEMWRLS